MKHICLIVVAALVTAAGSFLPVCAAGATDQPVTIWHIPHPDDEILGMGGAIYESTLAGRRNIVVMYTVGESSLVRINLFILALWRSVSEPSGSNGVGSIPLRSDDVARARLAETLSALSLLGVDEDSVIVVSLPDGAIVPQAALAVMRELAERYPGAAHRTTSVFDPHVDHRNLARALYSLAREYRDKGIELDVGFYRVYIYNSPSSWRAQSPGVLAVPVVDPDRKRQALDEFSVWDPDAGRFAIGVQSVRRLFLEAAADPHEYMDVFSLDAAPWVLRRGDIKLTFYNDGLGLGYRVDPMWTARIDNPYTQLAPSVSLIGKGPPVAYGLRTYLGGGVSVLPGGLQAFWLTGVDLLNRIVLEYTTHPGLGSVRIGLYTVF